MKICPLVHPVNAQDLDSDEVLVVHESPISKVVGIGVVPFQSIFVYNSILNCLAGGFRGFSNEVGIYRILALNCFLRV